MSGFGRSLVLACGLFLGLGVWSTASAQAPKESAAKKPVDVFNHIEGESTILKRKPAGTVVKKGDVVLELDSGDLRDALANQQLGVKVAEATYRTAKMNREVAEIGVKEFVDGISKEDIEQADAAIAQATAVRLRSEEQAKSSKAPEAQQALSEAQLAEQKAKAKKAILVKYTDAKEVKELESEVFKAKEAELKSEGAWQREKSKAEKLRRAIEACKPVAPIDGVVGYLRAVEEEDTFQQGEVMFRIFPDTKTKPDRKTN